MNETVDDLHPTALGGRRDWVATAKVAAKVAGILSTTLIASVTAYKTASFDGQERAQAVKNKSEAGYQVTRQAMEVLEHRVLVLEQAARRQEQAQAAPKRGGRRPPPPPPLPVAVTAHPKALPADLDKAERQVYRNAPQVPLRGPDAAPRER